MSSFILGVADGGSVPICYLHFLNILELRLFARTLPPISNAERTDALVDSHERYQRFRRDFKYNTSHVCVLSFEKFDPVNATFVHTKFV